MELNSEELASSVLIHLFRMLKRQTVKNTDNLKVTDKGNREKNTKNNLK
jgi:hypothetical protein